MWQSGSCSDRAWTTERPGMPMESCVSGMNFQTTWIWMQPLLLCWLAGGSQQMVASLLWDNLLTPQRQASFFYQDFAHRQSSARSAGQSATTAELPAMEESKGATGLLPRDEVTTKCPRNLPALQHF